VSKPHRYTQHLPDPLMLLSSILLKVNVAALFSASLTLLLRGRRFRSPDLEGKKSARE